MKKLVPTTPIENCLPLVNHAGNMTLLEPDTALLERLKSPPAAPPLAEPPGFDELTAGLPTAAWLRHAATQLTASPRWLDHVAALGLLGRVWAPTDPESRKLFALGELVLPQDRATAWLRSLSPEVSRDMLRLGLLAADDWERHFEDTLADSDVEPPDLVALLHARDDLESIGWAARNLADGDVLRARLDELDDDATLRQSELLVGAEAATDGPRLSALRWIAPELWWVR